jgi:hypothetical protein
MGLDAGPRQAGVQGVVDQPDRHADGQHPEREHLGTENGQGG